MRILPYLRIVFAAAVVYSAWVFWNRHASPPTPELRRDAAREAEILRVYGGTEVKILQFYAREGTVTEGGKTVICYGVVNAESVRIDPPVEEISPSINRCVAVAPQRNTQYTLIAQGRDGSMVSQTFRLGVTPDADSLPQVTSFEVAGKTNDYLGNPVYLLSFAARNPVEVSIDPPAFPVLHGAPVGRFYVAPRKTTTYTLTVTGKFGHRDQRQLTLEGPR